MPYIVKDDVQRVLYGPDGQSYAVRKITYNESFVPGQDVKDQWAIDVQRPGGVIGQSIGLVNEGDVDRVLFESGAVDVDAYDSMGRSTKISIDGFRLPQSDGTFKSGGDNPQPANVPLTNTGQPVGAVQPQGATQPVSAIPVGTSVVGSGDQAAGQQPGLSVGTTSGANNVSAAQAAASGASTVTAGPQATDQTADASGTPVAPASQSSTGPLVSDQPNAAANPNAVPGTTAEPADASAAESTEPAPEPGAESPADI